MASVIGIWPRFIEPNLLEVNSLDLPLAHLPAELAGLKIVQFSDLHLHSGIPDFFVRKLTRKILALQPDIIVFTGDFLCYAKTDSMQRLKTFLNTLKAKHGCFAILGNHDYAASVSLNEKGEYDILEDNQSPIKKGFARLFTTPALAYKTTSQASLTPPNADLCQMLKETPFSLLHNSCALVTVKGAALNICGLGEYMMGQALPAQAFKDYNPQHPGVILLHNPDGIPLLANYPGDLILCGHTHGGQVYLPWMWKRFTLLENMQFVRGLHRQDGKTIYINRGVGGILPFRWRARPEILLATLTNAKEAL